MNFKSFFLFILFSLGIFNVNFGQDCEIKLTLEEVLCDLSYAPTFQLSYDYVNPTSGARFYVNGSRIQDAASGENISILLESGVRDVNGNYMVVLQDTVNTACADTLFIENFVCDDCSLEVANLTTECQSVNEEYQVSLDVLNVGPNPANIINISSNGQLIGQYRPTDEENTFHIEFSVPLDLQGEFTVSALSAPCKTSFFTEIECLPEPECSITNISMDYECLDADTYSVQLSFDHSEIQGGHIGITDTDGTYYGLFDVNDQPISIEFPNNDPGQESIGFILESPQNMDCSFVTPRITSDCNDCKLQVNRLNTTCSTDIDNYMLELDLINSGLYSVSEYYLQHIATAQIFGPFTINPSSGNIKIELEIPFSMNGQFKVYDTSRTCEVAFTIEVECSPVVLPECEIEIINYNFDCTPGSNWLDIEYSSQGVTSDFLIFINGQFVDITYSYGVSNFVTIQFNPEANEEYEIVFRNEEFPECTDTLIINDINCDEDIECSISGISMDYTCINNKAFQVFINYEHIGIEGDTVFVFNKDGNDLGAFDVSEQPIILDVDNADGTNSNFYVKIVNPKDISCSKESPSIAVDCTSSICSVELIEVNSSTCNNDGTYNLHGTYNIKNAGDDGILMRINGGNPRLFQNTGSFFWTTIAPIQNATSGTIEICLRNNPDCCKSIEYTQPDCILPPDPCETIMIKVDSFTCNIGGTYNLTVFNRAINQQLWGRYVYVNGEFKKRTSHFGHDRIFNISPNLNSDFDIIEICLDDTKDCCETLEYRQPECLENQACSINDVFIRYDNCNSNRYEVFLRAYGDYGGFANVYIDEEFIRNTSLGGGNESSLGRFNLGTMHTIKIASEDDKNCSWEQDFGIMDCNEAELEVCPDCMVELESIECNDDGTFNLVINHNYFENGFECIDLSVSNTFSNSSNYSNYFTGPGPITLSNIYLDPNSEEFTISIKPITIYAPSTVTFSIPVECETEVTECIIEGIEIFDLECIDDNAYDVSVLLELGSAIDIPFTLFVNGDLMMTATTGSLQAIDLLGVIPNDNSDVDIITICLESLGSECCLDFTYNQPSCLTNVVSKKLLDGLSIHPNPTVDLLYINDIPKDIIGLNVIDNLGRTVTQISSQNDVRIDVSNYNNGIYTIQFFTEDNQVMSRRFVKM